VTVAPDRQGRFGFAPPVLPVKADRERDEPEPYNDLAEGYDPAEVLRVRLVDAYRMRIGTATWRKAGKLMVEHGDDARRAWKAEHGAPTWAAVDRLLGRCGLDYSLPLTLFDP
jgi:hypothetical protein